MHRSMCLLSYMLSHIQDDLEGSGGERALLCKGDNPSESGGGVGGAAGGSGAGADQEVCVRVCVCVCPYRYMPSHHIGNMGGAAGGSGPWPES